MNEVRRTLLKGMLASVVAGGIALPRQALAAATVVPQRMTVLLPGTGMDTMFQSGAEVAAAESGRPVRAITLPRRGGMLDPIAIRKLLRAHRGTRVAGLMDDAAYVLFSELARDAGVALLAEGWHSEYPGAVSRHVLHATPGLRGVGEMLGTGLVRGRESFAVAAQPFFAQASSAERSRSVHGFESFRVEQQGQSLCLHLAGLPVVSACAALDLSMARVRPLTRANIRPQASPVDASWPALLGYALCHTGSGCEAERASMAEVFLRGDAILGHAGKLANYASFVADI